MRIMSCLMVFGLLAVVCFGAMELPDEPLPKVSPAAAKKTTSPEPADDLGVVLDLQDGSRIVGRIAPRNLAVVIHSESIGEVKIPLERIRGIQFATSNQQVVVTLQNGDKLQGGFGQESFKLATAFGKISVLLAHVRQLEVRLNSKTMIGRPLVADDWERLPFPQDCDWPGPKGEAAALEEVVISLRGHPIRTKQVYALPLTIDYEVKFDDLSAGDGVVQVKLMPENSPRELVNPQLFDCHFGYDGQAGNRQKLLVCRGLEPGRQLMNGAAALRRGKWYPVRLEISREKVRITVEERTYEADLEPLGVERVRIELWGWHPEVLRTVRKFSVEEK